MSEALRFPVLAVSSDSFIVFKQLSELSTCTRFALENGYYRGLILLDSAGIFWVVKDAAPVHAPSFLDRLLGRRISIQLDIGPPQQASLSSIIKKVCEVIDNDPDDVYDQFVTHEELKEKLRGCRSAEELIRVSDTLGWEDMEQDSAEEGKQVNGSNMVAGYFQAFPPPFAAK
ncbi:MAG: hypothetical protein JO250_11720 [Armatimonadetes bacterium]|nr:hypothetical protein [Armatimonadota bacterium]